MPELSTQPLEPPFVGRLEYIQKFKEFVKGYHYRVLFIHSSKSFGKTRLLRRLMEEASNLDENLLIPHAFIDMYSADVHSIEGARTRIIELLEEAGNSTYFEDFRQKQCELEAGVSEGLCARVLELYRNQVDQAFFDDCRTIPPIARPILFLDAFEQVQDDIVGKWFMSDVIDNLPDLLLVIMSQKECPRNDELIDDKPLLGFDEKGAYQYSQACEMSVQSTSALAPLCAKVEGSPVLIRFALDNLDGGKLREPETLKDLSEEAFEEAMIGPFRESEPVVNFYDALVYMSYMDEINRPFDARCLNHLIEAKMISYGWTAQEIIDQLKAKFWFVKEKPDGSIQLYDEVERLAFKYLWRDYDSTEQLGREVKHFVSNWPIE